MKIDNPFDAKLKVSTGIHSATKDALIDVTDTLDFAWASARTIFEEAATPDHALKICEMMLACTHRNQDKPRTPSNRDDE